MLATSTITSSHFWKSTVASVRITFPSWKRFLNFCKVSPLQGQKGRRGREGKGKKVNRGSCECFCGNACRSILRKTFHCCVLFHPSFHCSSTLIQDKASHVDFAITASLKNTFPHTQSPGCPGRALLVIPAVL